MSQQINLFNPLFLRQEKYFSARTMAQSLGLIAVGLGLLYAYAGMQARDMQALASEYDRQLAIQREQFVKLGGQKRSKLLEAEVARLESDLRSRRGVLEVLEGGQVGDTEGFSRYFAAFGRRAMRGVWLTGFSVGEKGNDLRIRGRVLHPDLVPAYLKALNEEDVMRGRLVTELKLVAKEETAARGGGTTAAGDASPARFVEFDLSAPLRFTEPAKRGAPGSKP